MNAFANPTAFGCVRGSAYSPARDCAESRSPLSLNQKSSNPQMK